MENRVAAPALERGIQILRLLEHGDAKSLDFIASSTGIPKASAIRLLQTLADADLVGRTPDRTYRARARLVPLGNGRSEFVRRVAEALGELARQTRQTAEWYVPSEQGMVLVQRREPEAQQVHVVARIGFVRGWYGELDAVSAAANAFAGRDLGACTGFWVYDENGEHRALSAREARERVDEALGEGMSRDRTYNTNGVRRAAAAVVRDGALAGVLALAGSFRPGV
jgi:DNA-binding IclR family transcriptional regulator